MKKLFYVMIIALTIGCQKEKCEEVITGVELGVTYTAQSDGVLIVTNNGYCTLKISVNNTDNFSTCSSYKEVSVSKNQTCKVEKIEISHTIGDSTWIDMCIVEPILEFKTRRNE